MGAQTSHEQHSRKVKFPSVFSISMVLSISEIQVIRTSKGSFGKQFPEMSAIFEISKISYLIYIDESTLFES